MSAFWEFQEDGGNWKKCGGSDEIIEQIKSGNSIFNITRNGTTYKIIINGTQINLKTKVIRKIKCVNTVWKFKDNNDIWNDFSTTDNDYINKQIQAGKNDFNIISRGKYNYRIKINRGTQKNLTYKTTREIRLNNGTGSRGEQSSSAGAWGGQPSAGASAWGGQPRSSGASAWGGQPSSNEKSAIDLNNMIEHCNARFTCLHIMLLNNGSLEIIIPSDDSKTTNMGKGRAISQWENERDYETFISHLDIKIDELHKNKMYSSRVSFGRLIKNLDEPNRIQLWGANLQNYDNRASNGNRIEGSGQAAFVENHTQSTYGIITTPIGGVPRQGTKDFNFERFLSRNDTEHISQEGRESQFEPYSKTSKTEISRPYQEFIDNFTIASESDEGYEKAMEELKTGKKKKKKSLVLVCFSTTIKYL